MEFRTVYIGLGSNMSQRMVNIEAGIAGIERELVEIQAIKSLTTSPVYETEAWGMADGTPSFLNCVIAVHTNLKLPELLNILLKVEVSCGRIRPSNIKEGYSNRTLDCDILLAGSEVVKTTKLIVPHPRVMERRFVLKPLADLNPELIIPGKNCSVQEALNSLSNQPEVKPWVHSHT